MMDTRQISREKIWEVQFIDPLFNSCFSNFDRLKYKNLANKVVSFTDSTYSEDLFLNKLALLKTRFLVKIGNLYPTMREQTYLITSSIS